MNEKEKKPISKKRLIAYYLILAGCILLIAAITVTLVLTLGGSDDIQIEAPADDGTSGGNSGGGSSSDGGDSDKDNSDGGTDGGGTADSGSSSGDADSGSTANTATSYEFIIPVATVNVTNSYTFHYNQTLNCYYLHEGIDFAADAGTEVYAALDGTVTSITTGDELYGTVITLTHANNITTTYTYVDAVETLSVGDTVNRGDVIATVAEAVGIEYKDGPHLHFEIYENGEIVDPETKLAISDK